MKTIQVRTKVESESLHLPELRELIGKPVQVLVVELPTADRQEVISEGLHRPETPEEYAEQQTLFRSWLADPTYEHFWDMIRRWVEPIPPAPQFANGNGTAAQHSAVP